MYRISLLFILTLLVLNCQSDSYSLDQYVGGWSGALGDTGVFSFELILRKETEKDFVLEIKGQNTQLETPLSYDPESEIYAGQIGEALIFRLKEKGGLIGFLQNGHHLTHLEWQQINPNAWKTSWNLLLSENIDPTFYLSFDDLGMDRYAAYGFFRAPQCHYLNCRDFSSKEKTIHFKDANSGFLFTGELIASNQIDLQMAFLEESTTISLQRLDYDKWEIGQTEPTRFSHAGGKKVEDLVDTPFEAGLDTNILTNMGTAILNQELVNTHSVLIARHNQLVFEKYYYGFDRQTPHDTRSAAKSFASAAMGIAIDEKLIPDAHTPIMPYFEDYRTQINWDAHKDSITIHHLLTMSSGLDADDSREGESYASEGAYQSTSDWTKHILEAPMINSPGEVSNYGSANPHLLGPILRKAIGQSSEFYLHEKLFGPLGIAAYRIQTDLAGLPYFGGGWYFRPIDLIKFGQLYLNEGKWKGEQFLSADWVKECLKKQHELSNRNNIDYGYLWWKRDYTVGDKTVSSTEARGSGGQYIFVIPEYDMVVVITSGNYRNGKLQQPEKILEEYILRALK